MQPITVEALTALCYRQAFNWRIGKYNCAVCGCATERAAQSHSATFGLCFAHETDVIHGIMCTSRKRDAGALLPLVHRETRHPQISVAFINQPITCGACGVHDAHYAVQYTPDKPYDAKNDIDTHYLCDGDYLIMSAMFVCRQH